MNTQNRFYKGMSTPWGGIQNYHVIADGVVSVSTAGHGGIWLSDERIAHLPKQYKPFTGTRRWAEEDEDGALVLQYLGLLSLIDEPLTLDITQADINKGRETRQTLYGESWFDRRYKRDDDSGQYGGPIVEAYKHQTGDTRWATMICSYHLSPKPGGFLLARLCDAARDYMKHFDADAAVEPMTFTLEPFVVYERVPFVLHRADGKTWTDNVSGRTAHGILEGNTDDLDFYLKVFAGEKTVKITHEDTVIWQR